MSKFDKASRKYAAQIARVRASVGTGAASRIVPNHKPARAMPRGLARTVA